MSSDSRESSRTLVGTSFLNPIEPNIAEFKPAPVRDYAQIHRLLSDFSRELLSLENIDAIRERTVSAAAELMPCEAVHLFLATDATEESEIIEAFGSGELRLKNRFASDQLLLAPVRGVSSGAVAVLRFVNKLDWTAFSEEDVRLVVSLIAPLSLRLETLKLQNGLKSQIQSSIRALASTIEAKDRYTGGHTKRVHAYSDAIAGELPITAEERERVRLAGLLHDIGKIGVPDRILHKPSKLTELEWVEMRAHTEAGYDIVHRVSGLEEIAEILRHHHERWDGAGYPRGLREDAIPRSSRIIAVADTFDAMVTERPYRKAISPDAAAELIVSLAGTQFDPWVIRGFERAFPKLKALVAAG